MDGRCRESGEHGTIASAVTPMSGGPEGTGRWPGHRGAHPGVYGLLPWCWLCPFAGAVTLARGML